VYRSFFKLAGLAASLVAGVSAAGCGEYIRDGRSPSMVIVRALEGASGATPTEFGGNLSSDVVTIVGQTPPGSSTEIAVATLFGDAGRATLGLVLRDQGVPGVAATPTPLNQVTIDRYRVTYRRTDGRNTPGVDVPFPFDSAVTVTISADSDATVSFVLVRNQAKAEAPLAGLRSPNSVTISTIADVTFYGRDLAGNAVSVTGSIGVSFSDFGDPS
jgi:hypothetical protein